MRNILDEDLSGMSESGNLKSLRTQTSSIIRSTFIKICTPDTAFQRRLWNKWLPVETWVDAVMKSNLIDRTIIPSIKAGTFNAAMGRSRRGDFDGQMMSRFDGTNTTGIFRLTFQRTMFYIVTDKNTQVPYPVPLDGSWKDRVLAVAKNVFNPPATRSSPSNDLQLQEATVPSMRQKTGNHDAISIPMPLLQVNHDAASIGALSPLLLSNLVQEEMSPNTTEDKSVESTVGETTSTPSPTNTTRGALLNSLSSYWNSQDACNLFGVKHHTPLDDARDLLKVRVELLQSVNRSGENGWRNVIEGCDPDNLCSLSDIFAVRGRSMILCLAYQLAILHMNQWTWKKCCSVACSQLNPPGIEQATHDRAVRDWNSTFRHHGTFPHPNHAVRCGKRPLPLLFQKYPNAMDEIIQFGVKNLTTLTVESVHGFCHDVLIPKLFKQWQSDIEHSNSDNRDNTLRTKEAFLSEHRISTLSIPTCWRWLHRLGFTYNTQQKGYYVNGHERNDVVASRKAFCETYLSDIEPRCLPWIQVSQSELETTHNVLNPELGYRFVDAEGKSHVEFHVDYYTSTSQNNRNNELLVGKRPKISVRAPRESKPVEVFGQDESVFSQFIFPTKSWIGPNQERGLFPKSLGEGLMISAFVSRDSGFGMPICCEQLDIINSLRQGTEYIDKAAATHIYSTVSKPPLKESPFLRSLLIGATKSGYWNSFHMAIQLEDVVNCLKIVRPGYYFVFLFDHSQGHARKKDGALDAFSMSRSFGGIQPKIRNSKIVDGCLGPFNHTLSIGDVQSMVVFEQNHEGPWWILSEEGREARRYDILTRTDDETTTKLTNRTKLQLANALRDEAGITVDPLRPMNEIKEFANRHGVDLQCRKAHVTEGWLGKSKGLLQILWERGWIDSCKCTAFKHDKTAGRIVNTSFYTINGRKDSETGQFLESSSLQALMGQCADFKEEETALQFLGQQLGLRVAIVYS